jgi:tetratricopeptide (TPR) repeat protein
VQDVVQCVNDRAAFPPRIVVDSCTTMIEAQGEALLKRPLAFGLRGLAYKAMGDLDRAIADFGEAIRLDPNYVLAYFDRGAIWKLKGDLDRAMYDFDQAIRLEPNYALAHQARGAIWRLKGDTDRAIADLDEAIRLKPNEAAAFRERARAWDCQERDRTSSRGL